MLYPKEDKRNRILLYFCRICGFKEPAVNPCVYVNKIVHEVNELDHIIGDVATDPTLPRQKNKQCPDCKELTQEVVYFQSHSTKAEQGMRLYYVCCQCTQKWTDN